MMAKFKLRIPIIAKVMLFSIVITQVGESYLSIYILFFTEKSEGYVIALIAWCIFILFSVITYQYFAFELQRVKTFIQSKDILDFKIRMRRIQKIKLLYVSLVLLLIALIIINFLVFK
jgi:ABC-type branched-subunit amino acid transport system permease subunit